MLGFHLWKSGHILLWLNSYVMQFSPYNYCLQPAPKLGSFGKLQAIILACWSTWADVKDYLSVTYIALQSANLQCKTSGCRDKVVVMSFLDRHLFAIWATVLAAGWRQCFFKFRQKKFQTKANLLGISSSIQNL